MDDFFFRPDWMEIDQPTQRFARKHQRNLDFGMTSQLSNSSTPDITITHLFYDPINDTIIECIHLPICELVLLLSGETPLEFTLGRVLFDMADFYVLSQNWIYIGEL